MKQLIDKAYHDLVKGLLRSRDDWDAILLMVIFHGYRITFKQSVSEPPQTVHTVAALTMNHVAEIIASAWPERNSERAHPAYWHRELLDKVPSGDSQCLPRDPALRDRFQKMLEAVRAHSSVSAVEEED